MNFKSILLLFILLFNGLSFGFAQTTDGTKPKRHSLSERARIADSLRLQLHQAAAQGRALEWGDSLLQARMNSGKLSKKRYKRLRRKLYKYGRKVYQGDSLLAKRYNKITYDTMFIHRPPGRWTIKFRGNISGSTISAEGKRQGEPYSGEVNSDYRGTMSVAVTYRGIALGLALNPMNLAGKSKDNEFNLTSYGNRFGFDLAYLSSKTYKGNVKMGGVTSDVDKGAVSQSALNVNAYYAFNGKRFSIPAAFSQSYIQRRSAGSFLLGASLDAQTTKIGGISTTGGNDVRLKVVEFAMGAGYGYNLVAGKRWLFHLSALPTFDVFIRSHLTLAGGRAKLHYHFPSFIMTGRGAVVYSWKNKFAGGSMVFNFSSFGDKDQLHLMRSKWRLRLFFGFRI